MGNKQVKPRFKKGSPEASEAGKKSKRGPSFKTLISEIFKAESKKGKKGKLTLDNYMRTQIMHAMKGNATLAKEINDRYFGKQEEKINNTTVEIKMSKAEYKKARKEMLKEDDI